MTNHWSGPADPRHCSHAAERNQAAILAQMQRVLPSEGNALEIASGTGQHAAHFAAGLSGWRWQPTDAEPRTLASIDAWCDGLTNVGRALQLDVLNTARDASKRQLPAQFDAVFCANMLHISPWNTCAALMQLAAQSLTEQGLLLLYGPYLEDTVPTAQGNLAFDTELRTRDPAWGLRRLTDVLTQAHSVGLRLRERVPMPANNLLLVLERAVLPMENLA